MLLAEIHGKRFQLVESSEDYLTSAVFGHLRQVDQGSFWAAVFRRAQTINDTASNLLGTAVAAGVQVSGQCEVKFLFWPFVKKYGEPDLLMWLRCGSSRPLILVIEVKLFSAKSSHGLQGDQLCRYLDLLDDKPALSTLLDRNVNEAATALLYLTERHAADEVSTSIALATQQDAATRMFPLQ